MPLYEYKCPNPECGLTFSRKHDIKDSDKKDVCVCGTMADRIFSPPGIVFNGPGFYKTDNMLKGK